jgi:hypothetical protein
VNLVLHNNAVVVILVDFAIASTQLAEILARFKQVVEDSIYILLTKVDRMWGDQPPAWQRPPPKRMSANWWSLKAIGRLDFVDHP